MLSEEEDSTYHNAFSGKQKRFVPRVRDPNTPSIDAIFPCGLLPSGRTAMHCADNIAIVPNCLNFAKGCQLPIFLQRLSQYVRDVQNLGIPIDSYGHNTTELEELQKDLIIDNHRFLEVRMKVNWSVRNRVGLKVNKASLGRRRRSTVPREGERPDIICWWNIDDRVGAGPGFTAATKAPRVHSQSYTRLFKP